MIVYFGVKGEDGKEDYALKIALVGDSKNVGKNLFFPDEKQYVVFSHS